MSAAALQAEVLARLLDRHVVNTAFTRVQQLLAPPASLFDPRIVRRVRKATRRHVAPIHRSHEPSVQLG